MIRIDAPDHEKCFTFSNSEMMLARLLGCCQPQVGLLCTCSSQSQAMKRILFTLGSAGCAAQALNSRIILYPERCNSEIDT